MVEAVVDGRPGFSEGVLSNTVVTACPSPLLETAVLVCTVDDSSLINRESSINPMVVLGNFVLLVGIFDGMAGVIGIKVSKSSPSPDENESTGTPRLELTKSDVEVLKVVEEGVLEVLDGVTTVVLLSFVFGLAGSLCGPLLSPSWKLSAGLVVQMLSGEGVIVFLSSSLGIPLVVEEAPALGGSRLGTLKNPSPGKKENTLACYNKIIEVRNILKLYWKVKPERGQHLFKSSLI